jgi:hypothetical protein
MAEPITSMIEEEKAKFYAEEVDRGKILIAVIPHAETETTRIESEWLDRGSRGSEGAFRQSFCRIYPV